MRIFNETKAIELQNPDLEKGYLVDGDILIGQKGAIVEVQEQGHYEIEREYSNGGKDLRWVVDVPYVTAQESEPIFENVKIYIVYSEEELQAKEDKRIEQERAIELENMAIAENQFYQQHKTEIDELNSSQEYLVSTDYKAIQYAEGVFAAADFEPIRQQRIVERNNVRRLKALIATAKIQASL